MDVGSEEWVRPPRNGTNPNLAMGRGSRKNNNPYPKASRISETKAVSIYCYIFVAKHLDLCYAETHQHF